MLVPMVPTLAQDMGFYPTTSGDPSPLSMLAKPFGTDTLEIVESRWISLDGSEPLTYEEWKSQVGEPGPFSIQFVAQRDAGFRVSGQPVGFCVLVNAEIYPALEFQLERYMIELTGEGYDVELYTTSGGTPEDLRTFLREKYYAGLEGCIFIGDLPIAWYETIANLSIIEHFPCDLFYMDLDGDFIDSDGDGLFDTHTGDVAPDIWLGRLTASPLNWNDADEIALLHNYFEKNHLYRSGLRPLNNRALGYIDDDWANGGGSWSYDVSEVYDNGTVINDKWITWDTDYENRLAENYELIFLAAHSTAYYHTFTNPSGSLGETGYSEIIDINPTAYFYILFACSNARFVEQNYMAGWYIFSRDYGLAAVGNTRDGGMWADEDFYGPFANVNPIGYCLYNWLHDRIKTGYSSFYGLTLIGDPTLTIRKKAYEILHYDDDTHDYTYRIPDGLPYYYINQYGMRFTAPMDCTLDEVHFEVGGGGDPEARMYFWLSDGVYPTTIIDSVDVEYPTYAYGRVDISHLQLSFAKGEDFHISLAVLDFPGNYDYFRLKASDDPSPPHEHRSTVMVDSVWHTLSDFWGVERNLAIRACYDPAPGEALAITPVALPDGIVNQSYDEALEATGGSPPYEWEVVAGELPDGISLNPSNGILSGTPTLAGTGTYVFTARVTDSDDPPRTDIQHLQLSIPYCVDTDGDGFGDQEHPENTCPDDNCPTVSNPDQEDSDGDGLGDSCEVIRAWYVASDGTGDAPTIQAAIDSCTNRDTVLVAAGIYAGAGNCNLNPHGKWILLKSEDGPEHTIIDGQGTSAQPRRAFMLDNNEDSSCVIDGFTIRGGYGPEFYGAASGGGMLLDGAAPTVRNCIFADNSATLGGAVCVFQATPRFENCTFISNTASRGAAVFGLDYSTVSLENCIIAFNEGGEPISCLEVSNADLSCCDVYGNTAGDWVGCLAGQQYTNGNFSRNPVFCDPDAGDYTIDSISPCAPDHNYCNALIGAQGIGCNVWRYVCNAYVTRDFRTLHVSGFAKRGSVFPGGDIEIVPDYFRVQLTFCRPVDISVGETAEIYLDLDQDGVFEDSELCVAMVSHIDRHPAHDITIRVSLEDSQDIESARVAVYSVGEFKLIDESGQLIDYLNVNPTISGTGNQGSLAAGETTQLTFGLGPNHPNPFNSTTTIPYSIPAAGWVRLEIYDILGRRVNALVNEIQDAGQYETRWDATGSHGRPVPSGIYFYRLTTQGFAETKKMVLMK